jgi:hypothetical protein
LFGLDPGSEPMEGADAEVTELRQHRDPKRGRGR